jgi:hypothetical protein
MGPEGRGDGPSGMRFLGLSERTIRARSDAALQALLGDDRAHPRRLLRVIMSREMHE